MQKRTIFMLLMVFALLLNGCTHREPQLPIPVEQLAQDVFLSIGGKVIRLPLISLVFITGGSQVYTPYNTSPGSRNPVAAIPVNELITRRDSHSPLTTVAYANIRLDEFGYMKDTKADDLASTKGLCPLLTQIWAFELCTRGLIDSQNEFDPHGFTLIDEMYLLKLQPKLGFYAGDFATIGDAVLQMAPYILEPKVHCEIDKHGTANSLCTVVMRVEKNLLAIWSTSRESIGKTAPNMEAKSIRFFIKYGADEMEDFKKLKFNLNILHRRDSDDPHIRIVN